MNDAEPRDLWTRLIAPRVSHPDPALQLNARVVGATSLTLLCIFTVVQMVSEIAIPTFHTSTIHLVGYAIMLGAYFANRYGHYLPAALGLVIMFGLVPVLRVASGTADTPISTLAFATLSLLLGGVLLNARQLTVVAVGEISAVIALAVFVPTAVPSRPGVMDIVTILTIGTVISVFGIRHRNRIEARRRADLEASEHRYRRLSEDLNTRVRERTAELEAVNHELELFAGSASHDLRSPLMGIDGFAAILAEDHAPVLGTDGLDKLARIREATRRMSQLVESLLTFSRITKGGVARVPQDISARATDILQDLQVREPARKVAIVIAPGLTADADGALLGVVLDNLLQNAWKFTRKREDARIEVGTTTSEGKAWFFVRDNGAGFDMQKAAKLFEPFSRLHSPRDFEGHGVGLATVARIIKRHGGTIRAESKPDEGATFFFTLKGD